MPLMCISNTHGLNAFSGAYFSLAVHVRVLWLCEKGASHNKEHISRCIIFLPRSSAQPTAADESVMNLFSQTQNRHNDDLSKVFTKLDEEQSKYKWWPDSLFAPGLSDKILSTAGRRTISVVWVEEEVIHWEGALHRKGFFFITLLMEHLRQVTFTQYVSEQKIILIGSLIMTK